MISAIKKIVLIFLVSISFIGLNLSVSNDQLYEKYKGDWNKNWDQLLVSFSKVKNSKEESFKLIDSELNDFSPHYRKRGILAIKIDRFCEASEPMECSMLVNKYVKKANNRVLAAMNLNMLSEKNLKKSLENTYVPDKYYFLLKNKMDGKYSLENLKKDWLDYMHFLLRDVGVKYVNKNGVIQVLENGVFKFPRKLDVCVMSNKPLIYIDCKDCIKTNAKTFYTRFENYEMWYRSQDIKLEVSNGQELIINPNLECG